MVINLHTTQSPVSRSERIKINENWQRIIEGLTNLQTQINILVGGEIDGLLQKLDDAIEQANIAVQQAIDKNNEETQNSIEANNTALQNALNTLSEMITHLDLVISNAETVTTETNFAKQSALDAVEQTITAISEIRSFIEHLNHRGIWSPSVKYYKNNMVVYEGSTFIALQDTIGEPLPNKKDKVNEYWSLFVEKGEQGEKGEPGAGINILGKLSSVNVLPQQANIGDAYLIEGSLYIWNGSSWENVGNVKGEKGDKGEKGERGEKGEQGLPGKDADITDLYQTISALQQIVDVNKDEINKHLANNSQHMDDSSRFGKRAKMSDDWDSATSNGIYISQGNAPFNQWAMGEVIVNDTGNFIYQKVLGISDRLSYSRWFTDNLGWSEWTPTGTGMNVAPDSGGNENPNTTSKPLILTNHANAGGGWWYIETKWYRSASAGEKSQIATSYAPGATPTLKVRHCYDGTWTAWSQDLQGLFTSVSNGKSQVANAITQKGVATSPTAEFATMANNILAIQQSKYNSTYRQRSFSFSSSRHEVEEVFNAGFPIKSALIVCHHFTTNNGKIETTVSFLYTKGESGYLKTGSHSQDGYLLADVTPISSGGLQSGIEGNVVYARLTYFGSINVPAQNVGIEIFAWG